jgi:hypothetical protein
VAVHWWSDLISHERAPRDDQRIDDLGEMMILIASCVVAQAVDMHIARACIHVRLGRYDCVEPRRPYGGCADVGAAGKTGPEDD